MWQSKSLRHVWVLVLCGVTGSIQAQEGGMSPGEAALVSAARDQEFLFILFHKANDDATRAMKQTLDRSLAGHQDKARAITVRADDPTEKALIARWELSRTPMPIVLAVAPNGAVTGGFPLKLTKQDVEEALVSPGMADCLAAMQSRKIVLLCVQPTDSGTVPDGVKEFVADATYAPHTRVVKVRASDPAEADLLKSLQIDPRTSTPITALLLPPGRAVATFTGPVTKAHLVEKLKSSNACCPDGKCGPNGCCPPTGK